MGFDYCVWYNNNSLGEKLTVFIKFKNEILRTYSLRMTEKTKAC
jgi:hypothetical protein